MWKPVCNFPNYEVSSNGEVGNEVKYISAKEASRITGINQGSISKCCKGERRIAGGFRWRYEQED